MLTITNSSITLTRGDSASFGIALYDIDGNPYTIKTGDKITFELYKSPQKYPPSAPIFKKEFTESIINLVPDDTKYLGQKQYLYLCTLYMAQTSTYNTVSQGLFLLQF